MNSYKHTAEAEFAFGDKQRVTVKGVAFEWDGKQSRDTMAAQACAEYVREKTIIRSPLQLIWVSCSPVKEA